MDSYCYLFFNRVNGIRKRNWILIRNLSRSQQVENEGIVGISISIVSREHHFSSFPRGENIYIYTVNISSNVLTKRWTKSLGIQRSLFSLPLSLRGRAKLASTIFPIKKSAKFALPVLASPPLLLRKREKDSREEEGGRKKGVYTGGGRGVSRR